MTRMSSGLSAAWLGIRQTIRKGMYSVCPEAAITRDFVRNVGYVPNLKSPRTYNEKLQWLKLNWYDPLASLCADKYAVRRYVEDRGLGEYLNEVYGVYDSVDQIPLETLPDKFVLKTTHSSGQVIICADKSSLDWKSEMRRLHRWLKTNYFYQFYEWVYRDIKPRILCERLIETEDGKPPKDYKVFCFDGKPKMLFVASDRADHQTKFDFYTCDWQLLPLKQHYPNSGVRIPRPQQLDSLLEKAAILSQGFPHVRVDFYIEGSRIIFGEMTFFHFSGIQPFEPFEYDCLLGDYLVLPEPRRSLRGVGL